MKKLITLFAVILLAATAVQSATYLIYSNTGGIWTNTAGITNPVLVDLSTVNAGNPVSLDAWFADRSLATPTMGGGSQFAAGDEVWIISGTYQLTGAIVLFEGVSIYGGFAGSEDALSGRAKGTDAWDFTNETILDGNAVTTCISGGSAFAATIVDGLTISNGKGTSDASGGGATITGAQTTVQNCIIKNCATTSTKATAGGAIVLTGAATVKDSYIHSNQSAGYGAGITVCDNACTIRGCKITKNKAVSFGAGVNLYGNTSGVSVLNCEISNDTTTTKSGGGLLVFSTTFDNVNPITISGCTFTSNEASSTAGNGGALYLNTKPTNTVNITNCTFTGNTAKASKSTTNGGGAIWVGQGIYNIDKCTFTGNAATVSHGGAIIIASIVTNTTATISNSVFTGNTSANFGSALMSTYSSTMNNCLVYKNKGGNVVHVGSTGTPSPLGTFNNCTFASNTNAAGTTPVGIYMSTPGNGAFTNCLFYNSGTNPISGGAPTVSYCGFDKDLSATWTDPSNIFTITASSFVDDAGDDYHLATGSTAIDAGTTIAACNPDLEGTVRPQLSAYDMGAYEFTPSTSVYADKVEDSFNCYAYGNSIIVKGLEQEEVNIYSITGVRIFSKQVTGSMSIDLPAGIYIVNSGSYNKKVIVR
ncbi:MAG TPA: choice-of-anchor Q domain-containing protein [Paludibacter sp.]|nr:choice-of-anchor Q domain-containing protein [Paludibacter sp.]